MTAPNEEAEAREKAETVPEKPETAPEKAETAPEKAETVPEKTETAPESNDGARGALDVTEVEETTPNNVKGILSTF